jgi:hypothetical protein
LDDLTLIIKSMERQGNAWSVEGAMGPPNFRFRPGGGRELPMKFEKVP